MKKLIILSGIATLLTLGPAFAQWTNVGNCETVAKSEWARCIIERSQERSSE